MKLSKKVYIIGGILTILLIIVIMLSITLTQTLNDDDLPKNPPSTDPDEDSDEIPLPFTNALIVKINDSTLWARNIDDDNSIFVIKNWTTPFRSFDFYRKKNIYFGSLIAGKGIASYSKRFPQLGQPGRWYANQIAVDHVHDKVYVLDGISAKINIFDVVNGYYNFLSIDLNEPKDIAIDPVQNCLFILQGSTIIKSNLDGTSPKIILEISNLLAFQIDVDQKRIYLATTHGIQSVDYTGQDFKDVENVANSVVSLAALDNNLFWLSQPSYSEKPKLSHCKIINGVCKGTTSSIFDDNAVEIKAYNFNKIQMPNPCKSISGCDHMCIGSNNKPRCVCSIGWQLKNDSRSCKTVDEFLLYIQGDFVKGQVLDFSKDAFTAAILPLQLNTSMSTRDDVLSFDFSIRSRELIFRENDHISKISIEPDSPKRLIGGDPEDQHINPVVDWVTKNVYFIRIRTWGIRYFIDIAVRNLNPNDFSTTVHDVIRIRENYTPRSLVVHPNRGFLFFTLSDDLDVEEVQIVRANLDGTEEIILGKNLSISEVENCLAIDYDEDRLFWFDKSKKNVYSADLECSKLEIVDVSIVKNPTMINIYNNYIYISNLTSIWRINKKNERDILKILPVFEYKSQPIRGAKVFSAKSQIININHPCAYNNGGCKRFCLTKPKLNPKLVKMNGLEKVCKCNFDEILEPDRVSCSPFV